MKLTEIERDLYNYLYSQILAGDGSIVDTHAEIGKYIFCTREDVQVAIRSLKEKGIIKVTNRNQGQGGMDVEILNEINN